ncbi:MAG: pentapeptide repeat-containing protein [Xenococcus sp. MO_188.B8]|nr:pentapeptide repeat-containing protein [Xenococcus sp. MO_188.B8]
MPKLIIEKLQNDDELRDFFEFQLDMNEKKVPFPILFEQTFEQMGNQSNIFHVLGIEENLSLEAVKEFIGYLQYARERLKAKRYSLVFWITPHFEKELFFLAPDFHHWVFGTYDFTHIDDEELKSITSSANKKLFDVHKIEKYLEKVIWQYQNWEEVKNNQESFLIELMERADLYNYYIQSYCTYMEDKEYEKLQGGKIYKINYKEEKEDLLDNLLEKFIENDKQNFLTLLGDFGTGKTSFAIHYFIALAKKYIDDKTNRIPVFISLKDYKGTLNIEDFMVREFYDKFNIRINFSIFQQLAIKGRFIFFIDGFDEMASLTDQEITIQNLKELTKLSFENILFLTESQDKNHQANKVFLTSRTHYFLTESQEKDILKADYTILYRNYATKSNYEITRIKLKEFNDDQIREYIQKHTNKEEITTQYLQIIQNTYNLQELSTRPLLLDMIVKTMPILREKNNINPAALYKAYTNIWIERDDWRSLMTPQGKRNFMWELAVKMFELGGDFSLHYSNLDNPKDEYLKNSYEEDEDYYSYESTTCSFLNRDAAGNYKFIHKSFMEYFVAESFYWDVRKNSKKIIYYSSLNHETKFFFNYIIALHKDRFKLDALDLSNLDLSQINLSSVSLYQTNLSGANLNNADLSGANLSGANLSGANLILTNLSGANLSGANLNNANLSGANLNNANLSGANLSGANLIHADLSAAKLSDAILNNANLINASLSGVILSGVILSGVILSGSSLSGVILSGANLNNANLSGANLSDANLSDANLSGANLSGANLIRANLSGANLCSASLSEAKLSVANLSGANLSGANLCSASLSEAILIGVKITSSQIKFTHYWEQAIYKGKWDNKQQKWIIDKEANQKHIEQLKRSIE